MFDLGDNKIAYYHPGAGYAYADTRLNAFDCALLNSGCGNYNLVRVSSILPPAAERKDHILLPEGSLLPVAFAELTAAPSSEQEKEISAAVAIGIPSDFSKVGVIMEHSDFGSENTIRDSVMKMVDKAMETRGLSRAEYKTVCFSTSCMTKKDQYSTVFAYIAMF